MGQKNLFRSIKKLYSLKHIYLYFYKCPIHVINISLKREVFRIQKGLIWQGIYFWWSQNYLKSVKTCILKDIKNKLFDFFLKFLLVIDISQYRKGLQLLQLASEYLFRRGIFLWFSKNYSEVLIICAKKDIHVFLSGFFAGFVKFVLRIF